MIKRQNFFFFFPEHQKLCNTSGSESGDSPFDLDKQVAKIKLLAAKSPGFDWTSRPMYQDDREGEEEQQKVNLVTCCPDHLLSWSLVLITCCPDPLLSTISTNIETLLILQVCFFFRRVKTEAAWTSLSPPHSSLILCLGCLGGMADQRLHPRR